MHKNLQQKFTFNTLLAMKKTNSVLKFALLVQFGIIFLISSCLKDNFDFDKLSSPTLNPSVILPIAFTSLKLSDIVKEKQDTIEYLDNQTIRIVFRRDTLQHFTVDNIFEIGTQELISNEYTIQDIILEPFSFENAVPLEDLNDGTLSNGTFPMFAGLPPYNIENVELDNSAEGFNYVIFSSGSVKLTFTNNFPVPISAGLIVNLFNTDNSLFAAFFFDEIINVGQTVISETPLAGRLLTNQQTLTLENFGLEAVNSPVTFNLASDNINLLVESVGNLMVSSGEAIFPDQSFEKEFDRYNFGVDNSEQIRTLHLKSGYISYSVNTAIEENIRLTITFPTVTRNGQALSKQIFLSGGTGTTSGTIMLENYNIDLSTIPEQDYNIIPYEYQLDLISLGVPVHFDLNENILFNFELVDLGYSYADGYFLGQKDLEIEEQSLDLDISFFEDINGGLTLTNPIIRLHVSNGVGLPVRVDNLNLLGFAQNGASVDFGFPVVDAPYPEINQVGQTIHETLIFNRTNTNIVPFLALPPKSITYSGSGRSNPQGNLGFNNFVTDSSTVTIGFDLEFPLEVQTNNLVFQDTVKMDIGKSFKDITTATLHVNSVNNFPLDLNLNFILLDSISRNPIDTIQVAQLLSATVNNLGNVTEPSTDNFEISLLEENIANMKRSKEIIMKASITSAQNGTVPVILYTFYELKISVAVSADFEINLGD